MAANKAELIVVSGRYKGQRIPLRNEVLRIGRERQCEMVVDDESVSRLHSEIVYENDHYILRDLRSTNGTYLNEERITEAPLQNGDRIGIGDTIMMAQIEAIDDKPRPHIVFSKDRMPASTRLSLSLNETKFLFKPLANLPDAQRQVQITFDFMTGIAGILHLPALVERALDQILNAFPAERGLILLLTPDGSPGLKVTRLKSGSQTGDILISRTMAQQLLQKKESFVSMDAETDERLAGSQSIHSMRVKSIMAVPLKLKDKIIGMLYLDTQASATAFSEADLQICTALVTQLALCIENCRLYNELLDATEFSHAILRSLQSGIVVVDMSGRILRVNRAALMILGMTDTALLGHKLSDFPDLAELARAVNTTITTGTVEDRFEIPISAHGGTVPLGLSTSMLVDHGGKNIGALAHFRNLTTVRKLEEQLRRSQHMAALGQMAAGVAHEIRNPLNTIRGFTQLLQEKAGNQKDSAEHAQVILEEIDRMNHIVQDLLDFARHREMTMVRVDMEKLLSELVRDMQSQARKADVALTFSPGGPWPNVLGNGDRLRQVFRNIIDNGIAACKSGGSVAVSIDTVVEPGVDPDGQAVPGTNERKLAVKITDDGCGIDPVILPKIFDPFFTQKDTGTGLGLSISQKLVEQHSGHIEVQSAPGKGSTFTVILPAREEQQSEKA